MKKAEEASGKERCRGLRKRLKVNKNLVMLKASVFLLYGAMAALLPYLTIHMQNVGLSVEDIAVVYLALPLTTFLSPPITGFLVDKFGRFKPVVVLSFILNAVFHHSLLFIPSVKTLNSSPEAYLSNASQMWWNPCTDSPCAVYHGVQLQVNDCSCVDPPWANLTTSSFQLHIATSEELVWNFTYGQIDANITRNFWCGAAFVSKSFMIQESNCSIARCMFAQKGPENCPLQYEKASRKIFWIYFTLRFLATWALSAGVTMMDPIILLMIEKFGGQFGRERIFTTIGMAIFSPFTGILIDQMSRALGYVDYSAAFYTHDVLLGLSSLAIMMMPFEGKLPADHILKDLKKIVRMTHLMLFILFIFILGNFWGFIESFLFIYLKELKAPNYLLGLTLTVGSITSIPFMYGSQSIVKKFGHVNIIVVAFFSHAARLMGYSFINDPWWSFPFEALEAVAVHLMWIAAATYCNVLAPRKLIATVLGILGMAHFSLGRGSGSFAGGFLLGAVGTRQAFRIMGYLAILGGVAYSTLYYLWLRKSENQQYMETENHGEEAKHLKHEEDNKDVPNNHSITSPELISNQSSELCKNEDSDCKDNTLSLVNEIRTSLHQLDKNEYISDNNIKKSTDELNNHLNSCSDKCSLKNLQEPSPSGSRTDVTSNEKENEEEREITLVKNVWERRSWCVEQVPV